MKMMLYTDDGFPAGFAPIDLDAAGNLKSLVVSGSGAPSTTGLTKPAIYLDTATNNLYAWNTAGSNWQQLTGS